MRTNITKSALTLLILTIIGCQNLDKKKQQLVQKEYGKTDILNDGLGVELELNLFNNWKDLLRRTERIVCNDSLPKITLKSHTTNKTIYFKNPCWENFACILIKEKNVIEIHNDTINKSDRQFFPLDSLENVLRRDVENNGRNPRLSENPEKLLIYVSFDANGIEKLPNTLNKLTETYERITNKTDIKIVLNQKFNVPPPPPPLQGEANME